MKAFEYKKVDTHRITEPHYQELDIKKLNELGVNGWELIGVISGQCIFKREI